MCLVNLSDINFLPLISKCSHYVFRPEKHLNPTLLSELPEKRESALPLNPSTNSASSTNFMES